MTIQDASEGIRRIPLHGRRGEVTAFALVDAADYAALAQFRWHGGSNGYARRNVNGRAVLMHREVLGLPRVSDGRVSDHINRDKLDNRRPNLRVGTVAQNSQNVKIRSDNTSGHRGVYFDSGKNRWSARVELNGRRRRIGRHHTAEAAGRAAAAFRAQHMPFSPEASGNL